MSAVRAFLYSGNVGATESRHFMKELTRIAFIGSMFLSLSWSLGDASAAGRGLQTPTAGPKPPVYVSDFQIDVLPPSAPSAQKPQDDPQRLASYIVDLMSTKLVIALQKAGYSATRMHIGDARPDSGVQIRGLFAEVDYSEMLEWFGLRFAPDKPWTLEPRPDATKEQQAHFAAFMAHSRN